MEGEQLVKEELDFKTGLQDEYEFPHHDVNELARSISKFLVKITFL